LQGREETIKTIIIQEGKAEEQILKKDQKNSQTQNDDLQLIFKISPTSFFQTNTKANEILLQTIMALIKPTK